MVLHTLRYLLGDATFFPMLRRWVYPSDSLERITDGRQVRFVTTDELVAFVSAAAGRDLSWFFDVYVRAPSLPRLVETRTDSTLTLRWVTTGQRPFPMPVDIEVDGVRRRYPFERGVEVLRVRRNARVRIDPDFWVFRQLSDSL